MKLEKTAALGCPATVSKVPLLDVGRGNQPLKSEIMESISQIIDSGQFIGGPHVEFLEQTVAEICGAQFAIGCASGSDALLLALMALDIGPGDEVICPSFTFFATASAIDRLGAEAVFVDIDPLTFNLDPQQVADAITDRTRAIIPVHLFGQCADMEPLLELAESRQIAVVEDCAQSIGARYHGQGSGSIGAIGCFSFYPTKNLGGFGDGGMVTTNDAALADRIRLLANHGMRPRYYHQEVGINSRLDAIQAAVLCAKVKCIEDYSRQRAENAARYRQLICDSPLRYVISIPETMAGCDHVWNQFTIRIPGGNRDNVRQKMAEQQVGSEVYYPVPLHQQECFQHLDVTRHHLDETDRAATEVLSLPIFPELTAEEQVHVVNSLAYAMELEMPAVTIEKAA